MIGSTRGRFSEALIEGRNPRGFPAELANSARRKLAMIVAAKVLSDLRSPPGNRLEQLHGNREGQHSIRINNQWRVCFRWIDDAAYDVEIVDYH